MTNTHLTNFANYTRTYIKITVTQKIVNYYKKRQRNHYKKSDVFYLAIAPPTTPNTTTIDTARGQISKQYLNLIINEFEFDLHAGYYLPSKLHSKPSTRRCKTHQLVTLLTWFCSRRIYVANVKRFETNKRVLN